MGDFVAPDWAVPLDLVERLAAVPDDLQVKGLFFRTALREAKAHGNVVLDRQRTLRTRSVKHHPKPVAEPRAGKPSTRSHGGGSQAVKSGQRTNAPNMGLKLTAAETGHADRQQTNPEPTKTDIVSSQQEEKEDIGLTPKLVTVSVGIPSTYFDKVWHERNPAEEGRRPPTPDRHERKESMSRRPG